MLKTLKAGQTIRCTVAKEIRVDDDQSTVLRLMRFDPKVKRMLKSAQEHRVRTLVIVSRGKRPWECRVRSAKQIQATKGATWTMRWIPHVEKDFASVEKYLKIEAA